MMKKKINSKDIIRMVYESYKHILKEEQEKQQSANVPIDYHVSFYKGKYYFNITVNDKNLYQNVENLRTRSIQKLIVKNNREIIEKLYKQFGKDFVKTNEYKALWGKYSKYYQLSVDYDDNNTEKDPNNPDALIFKTPLIHPDTLFDEDGNVNTQSDDGRRISLLISNFRRSFNEETTKEEVEMAIKSAFYGVKNMFADKKAIDAQTEQLFFEVCQTIGTEETQKLLRTVRVGSQGFIFDRQLSFLNRLRVISQAQKYDSNGGNQLNTISYLNTERQWRKAGRQVVNFDHPYYIDVAYNGRMGKKHDNEKTAAQGMKKIGRGFTADRHANTEANKDEKNRGFGYHIVYDVQATVVVGYDEITNEPAMKNNLTGELNDIAKERIAAENGKLDASGDNRTDNLNNLFHTNDYDGVNTIYQSVCMVMNAKPTLPPNADVKTMIRETGVMIDKMLIDKLSSFKKGGGHIARDVNYNQLIPIGRIIVQAIIGLPMDSAPAIEWTEDHKSITSALSSAVNSVATKIIEKEKEVLNIQSHNITEMINIYSPMLVFEETFNNTLKLIEENAKYI
jgi:hypothetical protein